MRILIGYDGSTVADKALDDLRQAGLPDKGEAVVLCVADVLVPTAFDQGEPWLYPPLLAAAENAMARIDELVEQAQKTAARGSSRLGSLLPGWNIMSQAVANPAAEAILEKASEWNPDLICLGTHGHTALGRLLLGSVSHKVVEHARQSVRVARARERDAKLPVRLLIGVDGSSQADKAVGRVAAGRWPSGTQARVVAAEDAWLPAAARAREQSDVDPATWADKMVDERRDRLEKAGLEASAEILRGDARHVLLQEAEKWSADCIFVGGRGLNRIQRYLLGSVATALVHHAHCSVEVVR